VFSSIVLGGLLKIRYTILVLDIKQLIRFKLYDVYFCLHPNFYMKLVYLEPSWIDNPGSAYDEYLTKEHCSTEWLLLLAKTC
jgi:hypothetical protein